MYPLTMLCIVTRLMNVANDQQYEVYDEINAHDNIYLDVNVENGDKAYYIYCNETDQAIYKLKNFDDDIYHS